MAEQMPYLDPDLPVDERVEDLLGRMTLEEKVGQLTQLDGRENPEEALREKHVGSFLWIFGEETVKLQKMAEKTRLGIPLIFGIDAIRGHAFWPGATVFPTQLAMSCSWNPEVFERVGRITAKETILTGPHWTFSPVCGTTRDLRWGRVDETCGEDPYLIGEMVAAMVRGYQGDDLSDPDSILACPKHYAGYSETRGGRDASEGDVTPRKLLSVFLPPFRAACEAGAGSYMTAYQSIDGVPVTSNRWLLTEVLRDEWGFDGFVVTDWDNVGRMHWQQKVCATMEEAAERAVKAGNDMMMSTPDFWEGCLRAVHSGRLPEETVDEACRRVLRMKFRLGLFEHKRHPDMDRAEEVIGCAEHVGYALEAARQSLVLLKNEDDLLPLGDDLGSIAVIGPNADDVDAQFGDWALTSFHDRGAVHPRENVTTVLDGIRERADCEVTYQRGCHVTDPDDGDIEAAVKIAAQADLAVLVLGDTVALNGECRDRATLDLTGAQEKLLHAVHATETPVVLVLINGKPLSIPWAAANVPAILVAWNPGMAGGTAVAEVLFGDTNPCGKLTASWPRHVGQQPVYYNQVPGWHAEQYADMTAQPLFAFGDGLSYTDYRYADLRLESDELTADDTLVAEVDVENTGDRAGIEIVQLYTNDLYSSVTTPQKELKAFARVALEPGERKTVRLEVPCARLALINEQLEAVVEPGEFEVMVGPSSRDERLLKTTFTIVP
jgi:beta-glucosidase